MVVVEEGWPTCSIASEIVAIVMEQGFDDLDAPVLRVTNEDVPLPYAANLEKLALIDAAKVVAAVKKVTATSSRRAEGDARQQVATVDAGGVAGRRREVAPVASRRSRTIIDAISVMWSTAPATVLTSGL